eukprot:NODE_966_length_1289_cov_4.009724.p1 GENE.NODE_966_length_1289_cov_4.009724~~NODE_966_length_1289_cov_4.009724.p1  ORF type:complete len:263 (+),score=43.97 NODE_966_length_1289_cov_4.009724:457-1245(+)
MIITVIIIIRRHSCSVSLLQAAFARRTRSARDTMSGHTLQQTDVHQTAAEGAAAAPRGMPHGSLPAIPDGLATRVASAAAAQAPSAAGWHWKCYYCGVANLRARTECVQCGEEDDRRECSLELQRQRYIAYAADSDWPWVADAVCGDAVGAPAAATPCGVLITDKWAMLAELVRLREHALWWTLARFCRGFEDGRARLVHVLAETPRWLDADAEAERAATERLDAGFRAGMRAARRMFAERLDADPQCSAEELLRLPDLWKL